MVFRFDQGFHIICYLFKHLHISKLDFSPKKSKILGYQGVKSIHPWGCWNLLLKLLTEECPNGKADWLLAATGSCKSRSDESDSPMGGGESIHFRCTSWNLLPRFLAWLLLLLVVAFLFGSGFTTGSGLCKIQYRIYSVFHLGCIYLQFPLIIPTLIPA